MTSNNDFIDDLSTDPAAQIGGSAILATAIPSIVGSLGVGGAFCAAGGVIVGIVASPIVLICGGILLGCGIFNTIEKRKSKKYKKYMLIIMVAFEL